MDSETENRRDQQSDQMNDLERIYLPIAYNKLKEKFWRNNFEFYRNSNFLHTPYIRFSIDRETENRSD